MDDLAFNGVSSRIFPDCGERFVMRRLGSITNNVLAVEIFQERRRLEIELDWDKRTMTPLVQRSR